MCACGWLCVFGMGHSEQDIEKKKVWNKKEIGILNFFKLRFLTIASLDVCRRSSCMLYRDGVVVGEKKGDDGPPGIFSSSPPSRVHMEQIAGIN